MDKNTNLIVTLLVAIIAAVGGYFAGTAKAAPQAGQHQMAGGSMMHDSGMGMGGAMEGMMAGISGKAGDAFDRAFLEGMIEHHEGAVQMAKEALKNAKHEELKTMARAIITAQEKEIEQMRTWQTDWYGSR